MVLFMLFKIVGEKMKGDDELLELLAYVLIVVSLLDRIVEIIVFISPLKFSKFGYKLVKYCMKLLVKVV